MGNWGTPYMFGIYSVFAAAAIYLMIPTSTIDNALIKTHKAVTEFTATEYRGGSATKRHKRHKLKSCKKH
jgi:hypothetical protein